MRPQWSDLSIHELDRLTIRTGCETETNRRAEMELQRRGYEFSPTTQRWVTPKRNWMQQSELLAGRHP